MIQRILVLSLAVLFLSSCSNRTRVAQHSTHKRGGNSNSTYRSIPKRADNARIATETTKSRTTESSSGQYTYLRANGLANNSRLIAYVNDWLGTPHQMGGRSKSGVDCSGFTSLVMDNIYHLNFRGTSADMAAQSEAIDKRDLKEGDLVFFKIGSTRVSHVGVYLSNGYFAHATLRRGVMISSLEESYYSKYFSSAGRVSETASLGSLQK